MNYVSGQIIEAHCSRCKEITGHNVIVCIDGLPAKVECRACGSIHKFVRAVQKKQEEKTVLIRSKKINKDSGESFTKVKVDTVRTSIEKSEDRKKTKENDTELRWTELINSSFSQPIPYSMNSVYQKSSLIQHSVFGLGFVVEILPENKMKVFFRDGVRCLRCA